MSGSDRKNCGDGYRSSIEREMSSHFAGASGGQFRFARSQTPFSRQEVALVRRQPFRRWGPEIRLPCNAALTAQV